MAAKPTNLAAWNSGGANNVEPSSGEKVTGWTVGQAPPSSYFNWWQRLIWTWIVYLDDIANIAWTWTVAHVFNAGITTIGITSTGSGAGAGGTFTGGSSGGAGVVGNGAAGGAGGNFTGQGAGRGLNVNGGATGDGIAATGYAIGVQGTASSTGQGVKGTGTQGVLGVCVTAGDNSAGVLGDGSAAEGYGVVAQGNDTGSPVKSAFRIVPQGNAPSSALIGDLYVTTAGVLMINTGAGWTAVGTQT